MANAPGCAAATADVEAGLRCGIGSGRFVRGRLRWPRQVVTELDQIAVRIAQVTADDRP